MFPIRVHPFCVQRRGGRGWGRGEIGKAAGWGRGEISVVAGSFKKKKTKNNITAGEASAPSRSHVFSSGTAAARESRVSFPFSATDVQPKLTNARNFSETAEVPASN